MVIWAILIINKVCGAGESSMRGHIELVDSTKLSSLEKGELFTQGRERYLETVLAQIENQVQEWDPSFLTVASSLSFAYLHSRWGSDIGMISLSDDWDSKSFAQQKDELMAEVHTLASTAVNGYILSAATPLEFFVGWNEEYDYGVGRVCQAFYTSKSIWLGMTITVYEDLFYTYCLRGEELFVDLENALSNFVGYGDFYLGKTAVVAYTNSLSEKLCLVFPEHTFTIGAIQAFDRDTESVYVPREVVLQVKGSSEVSSFDKEQVIKFCKRLRKVLEGSEWSRPISIRQNGVLYTITYQGREDFLFDHIFEVSGLGLRYSDLSHLVSKWDFLTL